MRTSNHFFRELSAGFSHSLSLNPTHHTAVLGLRWALRFCDAAHARRSPPTAPSPVIYQGVKYSAPASYTEPDQVGGYIEASDAATGKSLWALKVYEVQYDKGLEGDVQHIFITGLIMKDQKLFIKNERGGRYVVDLKTHTVIKGAPLHYGVETMRGSH